MDGNEHYDLGMEVDLGLNFMQEHETWQMPDWWCRDKRPANDSVYFENMCRVIFQAGLNWQVIDNKWETTKKAFADFNINEVAMFYQTSDVQTTHERPRNCQKQRQNQSNHTKRTKLYSNRKTLSVHSKNT